MKTKKRKVTIAITGLNNIDSPGPGIAVIRGLRESTVLDVRIIGLSYENLEPGIYMHDLVDKTYEIPYPTKGHEMLLERLEYIQDREQLDLIIPNFDAELYSFIKLAPVLKTMGIATFLPSLEAFEERHKGRLVEFGIKYGVNIPRSEVVTSVADFERTVGRFNFPVVVKGKFYEAYIAYSLQQAVVYYHKIAAKWGTPIIVQEFIKGDEYNVCAIGDGEGKMMGAVPMRKTYITQQGKAWAGIAIDDPDLLAMAKNIIERSQWRGGMELELIKSDTDDKVYLIEINPRFPAWVYLTVGAGQNQPDAVARMALGEKLEPMTEYEVGKMFIRYSYDMICDLKEFETISTTGEL
jgi:carbamoyl-phosphate synthase large subunit